MNCTDDELHPHTRKLMSSRAFAALFMMIDLGSQSLRTVKRQRQNPSHLLYSRLLWIALEQVYMRRYRHRRPHNEGHHGSLVSDNIFIFTVTKTRYLLFLVHRTFGWLR